MALASSNETFSESNEDIIRISSFEDLKQKIDPNVNIDDLRDLFDFNENGTIETSRQELAQLREHFIQTGNLEAVKGFLERAKNSILEKTKKSVGGVKRAIEEGNRIDALSQRDGIEDGIEAGNVLDSKLEGIKDTVDKLGDSEAGKKVKEATDIAKKATKEMGISKGFDYIIDKIKSFGGWIGQLIAGILGFFKLALGFGDKAEKAKEITEKALSPKEIENTKSELERQVGELLIKIGIPEDKKAYVLSKLDPKKDGSYISMAQFNSISKKIQSGEKINLKDLNIVGQMLKDPEMKEIALEIIDKSKKEITQKLKKYLEKQYGVTIDDSKKEAFKNLVENKLLNNEEAKKVLESGRLYLISDTTLLFKEKIIGFGSFVWGCFSEGIIGINNILIEASDTTGKMLKIGMKSLKGNDMYGDFAETLGWEDFQDKLKEMPSEKKIILLKLFYAKGQLVSQLLGGIGASITSGIVSGAERLSGGKNVSSVFKNTNSAIGRLGQTLEILKPGEGAWINEMKNILSQTKESYEIIDEINKIEKIGGTVTNEQKNRLKIIKNRLKVIKDSIGHKLDTTYARGSEKWIKGFKENPIKFYYFKKHLKQLNNIIEINYNIGTKTALGQKLIRGKEILRKYSGVFGLREIGANTVMHISDDMKGKELLKALGKMSPEIVRGLFAGLPIIAVGSTLYSEMISSSGKGEWGEVFKMLSGLPGGVMIMNEAYIDWRGGDFKMENIDKLIAGTAIVGIEGLLVGKETLRYYKSMNIFSAFGRAVINSTVRLPLDAIKFGGFIGKTSIAGVKTAMAFAREGMELWSKAPGWPLKLAVGGGSLAILIAAVGIDKLSSSNLTIEEQKKILIQQGIITKNGEWDYEKLGHIFKTLDENKKQTILTIITLSRLNGLKSNITNSDIEFTYSGNEFTVKDKTNILNPQIKDAIELKLASFMNEIGDNSTISFA